jgi:flagellar protein FliS
MNGFGERAYKTMAVESGVGAADPHALTLMLYDGALEAVRLAQGHMAAGRVAEKGAALAKAARIVEEGLKASVDRAAGGQIAERLVELYDYLTMRLLQANLRNDRQALAEVMRLLDELRSAWAQIKPAPAAAPAGATPRRLALHA